MNTSYKYMEMLNFLNVNMNVYGVTNDKILTYTCKETPSHPGKGWCVDGQSATGWGRQVTRRTDAKANNQLRGEAARWHAALVRRQTISCGTSGWRRRHSLSFQHDTSVFIDVDNETLLGLVSPLPRWYVNYKTNIKYMRTRFFIATKIVK